MGFGLRGSFFIFGGFVPPFFYLPEIVLCMSCICPPRVLSNLRQKWDNIAMEKMIEALTRIGLPAAEIERVLAYYGEDTDGLQHYVLYMRAILDDGYEYV